MVLIKENKSYMEMTNISRILIWAFFISIPRVENKETTAFPCFHRVFFKI